MNIEIANRLVKLRKRNGLSQETLAEKLGISRQAVSKWERAEASPDTDNLIMLARLYGVSLDELLLPEEEITEAAGMPGDKLAGVPGNELAGMHGDEMAEIQGEEKARNGDSADGEAQAGSLEDAVRDPVYAEEAADGGKWEKDGQEEYVKVGLEGIHVLDRDGSEVHVGWDGIHVEDRKTGDDVHIDGNGVLINGEKKCGNWAEKGLRFPVAVVIALLYVSLGVLFHAWHPAWMLFLLIPLWYSFLGAVRKRNACLFAYPVFAALLYLCAGFFFGAWHPGWVIFLTVPVYYPAVSYLSGRGNDD